MSYSDHPKLRSTGYSQTNAAKPAVAAGAGAGTGPTVSLTGRDEFGTVSITAGTTPAAGTLATITFATPYTVAPVASVIENDSNATQLGVYCTATTTTLTISGRTAGTATNVYLINYVVTGGV